MKAVAVPTSEQCRDNQDVSQCCHLAYVNITKR